ncbi:restriction endonuclease subunit S [uncultured Treponema sp.]|uniref:restriction endonuclease subunit S n=1 Tax=uncultured Treponema sp. TaxID=162155 RepID=UPI0025937856|nr:restriction endonuclease subunit S [uncultured Treponema sp.]
MKTFYSNCFFEALKAKLKDWKNVEVIYLPKELAFRSRFGHFLWKNKTTNDYLEQQAQAIFKQLFAIKIENVTDSSGIPLGDIVEIIDNRGKTPPLTSERNQFPILDVGALNSFGRIINYKNCSKFVYEHIYNTFFRDGHPQENDILLSTVGSLAQMKFFKGNIGCIAQNVVAFRTSKLSPTYLYEYLKFIRNDLLAYDIGSVQPSIKVTHIIKHLIYIPTDKELNSFDAFSKSLTEQIYNNVCENERLISIRDTLLPKIMSGKLDVDSVQL